MNVIRSFQGVTVKQLIDELISFIFEQNGINDKAKLTTMVVKRFNLIRDRSVYYNDTFAIRFSQAMSSGFIRYYHCPLYKNMIQDHFLSALSVQPIILC
jgi:hypothetical protein